MIVKATHPEYFNNRPMEGEVFKPIKVKKRKNYVFSNFGRLMNVETGWIFSPYYGNSDSGIFKLTLKEGPVSISVIKFMKTLFDIDVSRKEYQCQKRKAPSDNPILSDNFSTGELVYF